MANACVGVVAVMIVANNAIPTMAKDAVISFLFIVSQNPVQTIKQLTTNPTVVFDRTLNE
jgi:hypothetical protein